MANARLRNLATFGIVFLLAASVAAPWAAAAEKKGERKGKGRQAVTPFNGINLDGWKLNGAENQNKWKVGVAQVDPNDPKNLITVPAWGNPTEMVNVGGHGVDIYTERKFGDATISLEFLVAKDSNSGVYVMGEYEIQVLDSYGHKELTPGEMGAIYGQKAPSVNASKKPGEWQTLVIEYTAPRFQDGKKTANAVIKKVVLNGQTIQENAELPSQTPGGVTGKEAAEGPLMFQGNHGPVAYRNIQITPAGRRAAR